MEKRADEALFSIYHLMKGGMCDVKSQSVLTSVAISVLSKNATTTQVCKAQRDAERPLRKVIRQSK